MRASPAVAAAQHRLDAAAAASGWGSDDVAQAQAFHDETLECVARGYRVEVVTDSIRAVAQRLAAEAAG